MQRFFYVYILTSQDDPSHHYTGFTEDPDKRLKAHNAGEVPHSAKYKPWHFETVIAFRTREKAIAFEKYLKSHLGRSFSSKHL